MRSRPVASFPAPDSAAGYASVAAVAVSLSLAVVAVALMNRSVVSLRRARTDFARAQAEFELAGVQRRAALAMITDSGSPSGAELETAKISLATAADLDADTLSRFGVKDPGRLSAWLREASASPTSPADLVAADRARIWKACAPTAISAFGQSTVLAAPGSDRPSALGANARLGQVWRLTARTSGWTDERIVRFTGEPQRPAAVIWRRFYRSEKGEGTCAAIFAQTRRG